LILTEIIKIVATRSQILRLKCTTFYFGWGSAPDPAWGAYSAPPDPLAGFKGPTSKGGEEKGGDWEGRGGVEEGRERQGGGERKRGREARDPQGLVDTPMFEILKKYPVWLGCDPCYTPTN